MRNGSQSNLPAKRVKGSFAVRIKISITSYDKGRSVKQCLCIWKKLEPYFIPNVHISFNLLCLLVVAVENSPEPLQKSSMGNLGTVLFY